MKPYEKIEFPAMSTPGSDDRLPEASSGDHLRGKKVVLQLAELVGNGYSIIHTTTVGFVGYISIKYTYDMYIYIYI